MYILFSSFSYKPTTKCTAVHLCGASAAVAVVPTAVKKFSSFWIVEEGVRMQCRAVICEQNWLAGVRFCLPVERVRYQKPSRTPRLTIALQLSLYWGGDLRSLSYFLNKRKEFEFYNWNPVDLQYLTTLVRGKVQKTIEFQGNSCSFLPKEELAG